MTTIGDRFFYKIVILGEGYVGKTSIAIRYCHNIFENINNTTLQASFLTKRLTIGTKRVELSICDTAGQERFHALAPIYYRGSNGAILVYDITDLDSFDKVKIWVKELRLQLGKKVSLIIVGNKTDLEKNQVVLDSTAKEFAISVNAIHMYTSAKLNKGIDEIFLELTKHMINNVDHKLIEKPKGGIIIPDTPKKSNSCC